VRFPMYGDTSGVRRFDYIAQAVRRAGPHKLIFGSDGPWLHPGVELHKIRVLGLPRDRESLILGGNILRLLRRVEGPRPRDMARISMGAPPPPRSDYSREARISSERQLEPEL
jgi:hypothetical protein